jgi:hypothetical protein
VTESSSQPDANPPVISVMLAVADATAAALVSFQRHQDYINEALPSVLTWFDELFAGQVGGG